MLKENKMSKVEIIQGISTLGLLTTVFFGSLYLREKGQNFLSQAKIEAKSPPPAAEEICDEDNYLADSCYKYVIDVLCDGQETYFNFQDDVCEPIAYWKFIPEQIYYR